MEKQLFFRADMAGLGKYCMSRYGRIGVYRVKGPIPVEFMKHADEKYKMAYKCVPTNNKLINVTYLISGPTNVVCLSIELWLLMFQWPTI